MGLLRLFRIALAFGYCPIVFSQQYAGQVIPNELPSAAGAEIAYWNIKDANGANTTLVNYCSSPSGQRPDPSKVQRVVVNLHGAARDPWSSFRATRSALLNATLLHPEVNEETVTIIAPCFPNGEDKTTAYPWNDGQAVGEGSNSSILIWKGSEWAGGERNHYPHSQRTVSSFDVVDQILQYLDDKALYPNVHQIVVTGHSLGAQMAQRYAAVGKELNLTTSLVYWIGNANSFAWLNSARPLDTSTCPEYDDWREGLSKYTNQYERDFVQSGRDNGAVLQRWSSREIAFARGLNDNGDDSHECAPSTAGADRGARLANWFKAFPPDDRDTVDYMEGVGHDETDMLATQAGMTRLFLDNFSGNGSRAADFGPRQSDGDDPHPIAS